MKNLTPEELEDIVYENCSGIRIVKMVRGESCRWTQHITTVFQVENDDRFYAIEWEKGLTEYQDNEFYYQPYEVKPVKKMIEVTEYIPIENK